ncbi:hypothetical protein P7K49_024772, partial [Saguinus oedipus]
TGAHDWEAESVLRATDVFVFNKKCVSQPARAWWDEGVSVCEKPLDTQGFAGT